MTQRGVSESQGPSSEDYGQAPEVRQRGARRRKLAGYLKAANELRQSYQQSSSSRGTNDAEADEDEAGIPGAFPDVAIVRSGDEEMVLFPSYARRHVKRSRDTAGDQRDGTGSDRRSSADTGSGNAEFWKKEWEKYEDDKAVADVDVRGWLYAPHRGQMTRKNRLLIGLARHLSGIPAPSAGSRGNSRTSSPHSTHRERLEARATRHEEALVEIEAENITRKGEGEAAIAGRGGYSEENGNGWGKDSIQSTPNQSRPSSPSGTREPKPGHFPHPLSDSSIRSENDTAPSSASLKKRASWNQPADMTPEELSIANANLMARLRPFLTNPLVGTPLTIFFYNDRSSQSRTIMTNEAGHFSIRAALDFVPTHVRVLASESLSATEEVQITEPTGISLISDIDDTIKHSGIGSGTKEIFRNVFIRDLGDLAIEGVKEWYTKLAQMGVKLHYVSNSPWQLYPVLVTFFAMAGLPPGSFHLKQYSGMLQGIFEPVAERKKSTLERILHDFPERRFLLVGDSGEADLELYTDIVLGNPGRILGVFIRDVTTPSSHGFFDASITPLNGEKGTAPAPRGRSDDGYSPRGMTQKNAYERKPRLPPRTKSSPIVQHHYHGGDAVEDLISFSDDEKSQAVPSKINPGQKVTDVERKSPLPIRPSKPLALRSPSGSDNLSTASADSSAGSPTRRGPLPPPKPRELSVSQESSQHPNPSPLSQTQTASAPPPDSRASSTERRSYRTTVRNKVASAYNSLPSPASYWYGTTSQNPSTSSSAQQQRPAPSNSATTHPTGASKSQVQPPPPPRRLLTSYPVAAAQYASHRISSGWSGNSDGNGDDINGNNPSQPVNKKLELWRRRWARARDILEGKGVMLRTWRVGTDVMDDTVRLVERAKKDLGNRIDGPNKGL